MAPAPQDPLAGHLGNEINALGAVGKALRFQAGQTIFEAGDAGNGMYLVQSGQVQISTSAGPHEFRVLAQIGPDDFFGEMAVVDGSPRSATATAATDTTVTFLDRDQLLQLLERRPSLALKMVREFSLRMRALNQKYVDDLVQAETLAAIGRFAGTIVHDFKNPLTVISIAAELACFESATPEMRFQAQERIARQIERMTTMLHELIEVTKPAGHRPKLNPMNFAGFMTPLVAELKKEMAARNITVVLQNAPPPIDLHLHPQRLSRLFYNLANNAAEEMQGGGTLFLRFFPHEAELRVEVEDTGKGIPPEIARTLFQPFATHGKTGGTGLGLSICKRIVEDHGGRISAESAPGKGATFVFTLARTH